MIHLRVPGSLRYRDLAVRVVGAACKLAGSPATPSHPGEWDSQVVSAFGEAFNNAAIHAYRGAKPGEVVIEVEVAATHITIRLFDYGNSFDFEKVPSPDLEALPESGLGLFIIRSFMDEVTYQPGSPNVLSMTKWCDPISRPGQQPVDAIEGSSGGDSRR